MRKAVGFSPTSTPPGRFFSSCGFYLSATYVQLEFGESAAPNQVRLLYTTLRWLFFSPNHFSLSIYLPLLSPPTTKTLRLVFLISQCFHLHVLLGAAFFAGTLIVFLMVVDFQWSWSMYWLVALINLTVNGTSIAMVSVQINAVISAFWKRTTVCVFWKKKKESKSATARFEPVRIAPYQTKSHRWWYIIVSASITIDEVLRNE